MDDLLEEKCSQHDLEFIAVKIGLDNQDQNKYLCPQCLIELINPKELILIREAKRQIQIKKNQISKSIEEECKQKINLATNLKNSLQEIKSPFEQLFIKLNEEIDQFKIQNEKQKQESQIITPGNLDTDLALLADEETNQLQQKTQENDLLLIQSLLKQFQFCQISSLSKQKIIEIISKCIEDERIQNAKLTPSLKFRCQNHGQEIIMVQLDHQNKKLEQYSCVQCISENQGKYMTLQQLQKSIQDYYQVSEKSLKYCQKLRKKHTNEIIKFCKELCDKYVEIINLHIKELEENFKSFEKIIETNLQFKDHNIFQLELEEINQILLPLCQNSNYYYQIIEQQIELDKQLYVKFEEQIQEFCEFSREKFNLIKLEQEDHQNILKKLEEDQQQDQLYLDNEINRVQSKYMKKHPPAKKKRNL
ncbi:unnamed protein product (macronuclear) [Paramecium tetraurelia]|uniref:Uncharacterized protein n=1 Tax=Paramecium tetraurelia TaxID=5888 RepID=A0BZ84_PARTE|nr:uncharacterized protein GSPATT00033704001 [Paramecium tetraurelia]CAK63851.1 unnamed protein product [Paramecium tetraurelia]|eukprot:XP_001431249.1 hypothetical protein (macronuclear) [Paramecium tetraurelia strain d4-2]